MARLHRQPESAGDWDDLLQQHCHGQLVAILQTSHPRCKARPAMFSWHPSPNQHQAKQEPAQLYGRLRRTAWAGHWWLQSCEEIQIGSAATVTLFGYLWTLAKRKSSSYGFVGDYRCVHNLHFPRLNYLEAFHFFAKAFPISGNLLWHFFVVFVNNAIEIVINNASVLRSLC